MDHDYHARKRQTHQRVVCLVAKKIKCPPPERHVVCQPCIALESGAVAPHKSRKNNEVTVQGVALACESGVPRPVEAETQVIAGAPEHLLGEWQSLCR